MVEIIRQDEDKKNDSVVLGMCRNSLCMSEGVTVTAVVVIVLEVCALNRA